MTMIHISKLTGWGNLEFVEKVVWPCQLPIITSTMDNPVECFHVVINQNDSQDSFILIPNSVNCINDDDGDNISSKQDGEMCVGEERQICVKEVGLKI